MPERVTKIKVKKGVYYFAWEIYQETTKNWDQHTLSCKDPPREELKERIQVMANHVAEICEFPDYDLKKLIVSGITLSYGDEGNCYLVITAQKHLEYSKAPLIINTPARPAEPENENDDPAFCWSDELARDIGILEEEAWKYINGDRAQQKLDFAGGAEKPAEGGRQEESEKFMDDGDILVGQENIGA